MNFQSVISLLHQFWSERGCLIAMSEAPIYAVITRVILRSLVV